VSSVRGCALFRCHLVGGWLTKRLIAAGPGGCQRTRLSHRVTGSTGSERPAPVPVLGTGRYRPVIIFVLVPHTDWPTGPGRLLLELEFGKRPTTARAACGGDWRRAKVATKWFRVPGWQAGMGCASAPILEPHICTYLYIDSGKKKLIRVLFSPCDPSGRHRALSTNRSGKPGTGSPVPVPVRVRQPSQLM
jgi:hypothetical protein